MERTQTTHTEADERTTDEENPDWRSIAESSHHPEHWHYGDENCDDWASITASNTGTIGGYPGDYWMVEFYNGEVPVERKRADTYAGMLGAVAGFMEQHQQALQEDDDE